MKTENKNVESQNTFCKQYHKRERNVGCLIETTIRMSPKRDGNRMSMLNDLIREGWELTSIEDCRNEIFEEWLKFTLVRWV